MFTTYGLHPCCRVQCHANAVCYTASRNHACICCCWLSLSHPGQHCEIYRNLDCVHHFPLQSCKCDFHRQLELRSQREKTMLSHNWLISKCCIFSKWIIIQLRYDYRSSASLFHLSWGGSVMTVCVRACKYTMQHGPINHRGLCENELYCVVSWLGGNHIPWVSLPPALLKLNGKRTATINNTIV